MRVHVDRDRCCSSGNCAFVAPEVFDLDEDDALVTVQLEEPSVVLHERVREAAIGCPTGTITVVE